MRKEEVGIRWTRVRGVLMELWGEVAGHGREFDDGRRELVIAALQEKYGMSREEAEVEFETHIRGEDTLS